MIKRRIGTAGTTKGEYPRIGLERGVVGESAPNYHDTIAADPSTARAIGHAMALVDGAALRSVVWFDA